jgi:hypothetical protein
VLCLAIFNIDSSAKRGLSFDKDKFEIVRSSHFVGASGIIIPGILIISHLFISFEWKLDHADKYIFNKHQAMDKGFSTLFSQLRG